VIKKKGLALTTCERFKKEKSMGAPDSKRGEGGGGKRKEAHTSIHVLVVDFIAISPLLIAVLAKKKGMERKIGNRHKE